MTTEEYIQVALSDMATKQLDGWLTIRIEVGKVVFIKKEDRWFPVSPLGSE